MHEEEIHFGKLFLKQFEMVLVHLTLMTFDPVTPKSIAFLCYPGWMCGPSLREVGQGVLHLLIGHVFGTFVLSDIDRPTGSTQYALSSSNGGITNRRFLLKKNYW